MSPRPWILAVTAAAGLAGCGSPRRPAPPPPEPPAETAYKVTIRWTSFDVPHVIADDLGSLGFGQGWASAKQHLCRLADQFVRVRGERARYFGAGDNDTNLSSDLLHLHLGLDRRGKEQLAAMSPEARQLARGWAAGYNHYVAHTPAADWPEPCRDAPWVTAIDELDLARFGLGLATIASSRRFEEQIVGAAPDGGAAARLPLPDATPQAQPASNGWALGAERTETGHGLLIANPHFPWEGDLTFSEIHLTLRGDFDVYGATIPGVPMVGIGFTRTVAWTHTFSSSTRFLLYRLRLSDGDPLRYDRDGDSAPISARSVAVEVLQPDGSLDTVSRTLYRSDHGPMIASALTPWTTDSAYALRDVALDSAGSAIDLYLGFARAQGLDDFRAALGHHATPFLNTIYADVEGNAWYVDGSSVPNLSDEALASWELMRKAVPDLDQAWQLGVAVVDGSTSLFDVVTDDPNAPGAVAVTAAPELLRRDYVFNANDSYAYTNPAVPMTGHSPLYGAAEGTPTPRTLMNLRMLREKGVAAAAGSDGVFSRKEAVTAMLSNRSFTGEQLRDLVLARCERSSVAHPVRPKPQKRKKGKKGKKGKKAIPEEIHYGWHFPHKELCTRLAEWDLRFDLDSRGAVLWRELMAEIASDGEVPWKVAFDPAAPSTPSGLAETTWSEKDPLLLDLRTAAERLRSAGIDVFKGSVALGDVQHAALGSKAAVPGGAGLDGVANVVMWVDWNGTLLPRATRQPEVSSTGLGTDGYPVNYGTSWVMAVDLLPQGPEAEALMTYGPPRMTASTDPDDDPLALLGKGQLRPALFDEQAINADPNLVIVEIETP